MKENDSNSGSIIGGLVGLLLIGGPALWAGLRLLGYDLGWHELLYLLGGIVVLFIVVRLVTVLGVIFYLAFIIFLYFESGHIGWFGGIVTGIGLLSIFAGILGIIGHKNEKKNEKRKPRQKETYVEEVKDTSSKGPDTTNQQQQVGMDQAEIVEDLRESIKEALSSAETDQARKPQITECSGCGNKIVPEAIRCEYCDNPV